MTQRENLLSLLRRTGYEHIPVDFNTSPILEENFRRWKAETGADEAYFQKPWQRAAGETRENADLSRFEAWHSAENLANPAFSIDGWGVGHLKTPSSKHMSHMFHPLETADSLEQIEAYPLSGFNGSLPRVAKSVEEIHQRGLAAVGEQSCTIWETSWYIRGMESLMMDMLDDDPKAQTLLDRVTAIAVERAEIFAAADVDVLLLGDDIGMQQSLMMSKPLYLEWLAPRLKKVIDHAKKIKPDLLVSYHSCGYVEPMIPYLIEYGVDILNPVQPECMDFGKLHAAYGDVLSFHGTIGTQTTMPFGSPADVRREVEKNLRIAGKKGGLFPAPTHLLEPEVPPQNLAAYVDACRRFKG